MYTNWETAVHPNVKKPKHTLLLNAHRSVDSGDELIPKIAYCLLTIWNIFIFDDFAMYSNFDFYFYFNAETQ